MAEDAGLPDWIRPERKFDWARSVPLVLLRPDPLALFAKLRVESRGEASVLRAGTQWSVLIDHQCQLQGASRNMFSQLGHETDWANVDPAWRIRAHSMSLPFDINVQSMASQIESDPCVIAVSPETLHYRMLAPNDTSYSSQSWLAPINAPTAWDTYYGSSGITGTTTVAVVDDGGDTTHEDFSGMLWVNTGETAGNSIDDDANGYVDDVNGYNFTTGIGSPAQEAGSSHGTHVGGFIGAKLGNSKGIAGLAGTHARLMFLNVFGPNAGASTTDIVNGITYARNKSAAVINLSLGGAGTSVPTKNALVNAANGGAFVAIAAGNSSAEITAGAFVTPAGYAAEIEGVMSVASIVAQTDALSSFSNYSTTYVEIAAPGSDSVQSGLLSTEPGGTYGYKQGTSMASPILAGAAALAVGLSRSLGASRTPAQIETLLKSSSTYLSGLSGTVQGGRKLNTLALAQSINCR